MSAGLESVAYKNESQRQSETKHALYLIYSINLKSNQQESHFLMSVLVNVLRIRLQKNPINKVVLAIYSANEQILSQPANPHTDPQIHLTFLISRQTKVVSFAMQELIADGKYFIIGKLDLYLYNIDQLKQGEKSVRMLELRKIAQAHYVSDLAMFAGSITFQISHSKRRKILSEIQRIEIIRQTLQAQDDQIKESIQHYQELSNISNQKLEKQIKQQIAYPLHSKQKLSSDLYQIDRQGYITLKPLKAQLQLQQILSQSSNLIEPQQQKLKLSAEQIKQFIEIDPKKIKESAVRKHYRMKEQKMNKKPPIFQQVSTRQKEHIGVNPSPNMFEVYTMCCGEQIDTSNQIQQSY